jgi:hypothetical protein
MVRFRESLYSKCSDFRQHSVGRLPVFCTHLIISSIVLTITSVVITVSRVTGPPIPSVVIHIRISIWILILIVPVVIHGVLYLPFCRTHTPQTHEPKSRLTRRHHRLLQQHHNARWQRPTPHYSHISLAPTRYNTGNNCLPRCTEHHYTTRSEFPTITPVTCPVARTRAVISALSVVSHKYHKTLSAPDFQMTVSMCVISELFQVYHRVV